MRSLVTSISLYACESWTLSADLQSRIRAMEIMCYRKRLRISYKDPAGNRTTRRPPDRRKETKTAVVWIGLFLPFIRSSQNHLARHSERGKKTRQTEKKRREDDIREWTDLEFARSQGAVENRENGGNWLRSYLWCPSDPHG